MDADPLCKLLVVRYQFRKHRILRADRFDAALPTSGFTQRNVVCVHDLVTTGRPSEGGVEGSTVAANGAA